MQKCSKCNKKFWYPEKRKFCINCKPRKILSNITKEDCKSLSKNFNSLNKFRISYPKHYKEIKINGWFDEVCGHINTYYNTYSYEECLNMANKCSTKVEFLKRFGKYYRFAYRYGWLNNICKNLKQKEKITIEKCIKISSKYQFPSEFKKYEPSTYQYCVKNGWLNLTNKHMEKRKRGLSKSRFIECCSLNNNGTGILYCIKCFNKTESFYKIGITSLSIIDRYCSDVKMPYNYNLIWFIEKEPSFVFDYETCLKRKLKKYHYIPKNSFNGSKTECFKLHGNCKILKTYLI